MKFNLKLAVLSIFLAAAVGLGCHIFLLKLITPIVNKEMVGVQIAHPPYSVFINIAAYLTVILSAAGMAIVYYFLAPHFPFNSRVLRGLCLAALVLLVKGELIRVPIMNILVGNPIKIALLQQSQIWISNIAMALMIAFVFPRNSQMKDGICRKVK